MPRCDHLDVPFGAPRRWPRARSSSLIVGGAGGHHAERDALARGGGAEPSRDLAEGAVTAHRDDHQDAGVRLERVAYRLHGPAVRERGQELRVELRGREQIEHAIDALLILPPAPVGFPTKRCVVMKLPSYFAR